MSRITKILTGIAVAVAAVALVSVPAKADAASDALNAGLIELQKIAAQTANDQAAVQAAAQKGLALAQARQDEIAAQAAAGLASAQANLDAIAAQTASAAAWVAATAAAGL